MPHFKDSQNNLYWLDAHDNPSLWLPNCTPITDTEATSIRAAAQAVIEATKTYAQKRAEAYPSIPDQLDLLYHGGMEAWKAAITAVKQEFPKP